MRLRRLSLGLLLLCLCTVLQGQEYRMPALPDSLRDTPSRVRWAVTHYWDDFHFSDTTLLTSAYGEQALVNYLSLMPYASAEVQSAGISRWWQQMKGAFPARRFFFDGAEHYLYHPNSPMRNEELYRLVLSQIDEGDGDDLRSRARFALRMLNQNKAGDEATDVSLLMADGSESSIRALTSGTPTLLLFYDPECEHCQQMLALLTHDTRLSAAIASGSKQLLAVYTGEDLEAWRRHLGDLPATWRHAADRGVITAGMLYDLRSLPVLYLLDADGVIAKKEASVQDVAEW